MGHISFFWTNKYPNIFINIFVQNIRIYLNIRYFAQQCFGLFWPISYLMSFWTHIQPFLTNNNYFEIFFGKKENSYIFDIIDIEQIDIQLYLSVQIDHE